MNTIYHWDHHDKFCQAQKNLFLTYFANPSTLLEPQYLCVIRHQRLSISSDVLMYYTNRVTLRKVWNVNKERKTSGI